MSRRPSLPPTAELFRLTSTPAEPAVRGGHKEQLQRSSAARGTTGRQKHDTKITVYLSGDELVAMEQARLALRAKYGMVVDRGRLVREAVAVLLADFEQHGPDSVLMQRLRADGLALETEEASGQ
ncbi:MAG TPA: cobyrinic acid ac-diamide synthase [Amycolatopsis sp.]|uniref:cobyrinic acid ac-diamide synthase n=1 Tax=Amycolatopsis sp. TaxID=37632 RepID=UPI002B47392D|nr:cobyrinic acid ac-diamide synthase [Amycolatopsis sp.]HKS45476.1 cobyrinic acid ac-diamide synthase [Amycolatopsis sp.]